MSPLSFARNSVWLTACLPGYLRFRHALSRPRAAQEQLLARYLRVNRDTAFGRRHDFESIKTLGAYQKAVPVSRFEDYTATVDEILGGREGLLTAQPVRALIPTSGSSQAQHWVPYTNTLQAEFARGLSAWVGDLAFQYPGVLGGDAYWSVTPLLPGVIALRGQARTPAVAELSPMQAALATGDMRARFSPLLRALTHFSSVDCADLSFSRDAGEFRRVTLLRLLATENLSLICVRHPSYLLLLLDELLQSWSSLLTELSSGRRAYGPIRGLVGDPRRAAQLRRQDPSRLRSLWPQLALVSCWGDASAAADLALLRHRLGGVPVQVRGLASTEALVSVPFRGSYPLAVRSHFFEFIDAQGVAYAGWDIKEGERYSVVVTTGGGLYRYLLNDHVQVTGFLGRTPCLQFLGKDEAVSDLCGEKLGAAFVSDVLTRLLATEAPGTRFALLAPERGYGRPGYVLYVDSVREPTPGLAEKLDQALSQNPCYAVCVRMGQLQPVSVQRTAQGAQGRYLERLSEVDQGTSHVAACTLSALSGWRDILGIAA